MDKIFSARVDESIVRRITLLAQRLKTSKKSIIEQAIEFYASRVEDKDQTDVFDQTFAAWKRKEAPDMTVEKARREFRKSMMRFQA